jgi:hypothetical protein
MLSFPELQTLKKTTIPQKKGIIVGMFPRTSIAAHFGRVHFQEAVSGFLSVLGFRECSTVTIAGSVIFSF